MARRLEQLVRQWADELGLARGRLPGHAVLEQITTGNPSRSRGVTREGASDAELSSWEQRHGYGLPRGIRTWLRLSDGLYTINGPTIHPLMSIGPMIPFAAMPEVVVQPESWYELGNPGIETVCVDLGYVWPGGGPPIFTSGDDIRKSRPRIIAPSFEEWFLRMLHEAGRAYWLDPDFESLGDPWEEHRRRAPVPPLPERLEPLAERARKMMSPDADERRIAGQLGVSLRDVEALFRHLQHEAPGAPDRRLPH